MYFRLMGKLNARRNGLLSEEEKGFTLIELLVVVIIIGILAAIAIPVYLSVQNNAKNSAVQTDVTNLKTAIVSLETSTGSIPTPFPAADGTASGTPLPTADVVTGDDTTTWTAAGATLSKYTNNLVYTTDGTSKFCVEGDSVTGKTFAATDSTGVQQGATCGADGVLG